jgi:hypothetical protein
MPIPLFVVAHGCDYTIERSTKVQRGQIGDRLWFKNDESKTAEPLETDPISNEQLYHVMVTGADGTAFSPEHTFLAAPSRHGRTYALQ